MRLAKSPGRLVIMSLLLAALVGLALIPSSARAQNGAGFYYTINELTGNRYRLDFVVENFGPERDAIFKWTVWGVNPQWNTVSFWPPEWDFNHPDGLIQWQTDNGSYPGSGYYRLFGQEGAPEPNYGWTGLVFQWTFTHDGGPSPLDFYVTDYRFHFQTINEEWLNDGPSYTYPGPIATEQQTWGGVKRLYR